MKSPANASGPEPLAVSVRGLSYQYPHAAEPALNKIDLQIRKGDCFGLLGPNGAGKTTLLSILTGMLAAQHGEVRIAGHGLGRSAEIKKRCAIVPQDLAFYPGLTGRENLEFFAGLYGLRAMDRKRQMAESTDICGLREVLDKRAETYSGGLKRRLNLAIGLLNGPEILYLDEPTVGIDAQSRSFILEAIRSLKAGGMTVVYTSHYMEEVQAVCDQLAIVDNGRIVLESSLAELLDQQQKVFDLTLSQEPEESQLSQLADLGESEVHGRHLKIYLNSSPASLDSLIERIRSAGLEPRQIQYGMNRLEDIYLSITKRELRD
ncbi:ABC transporter ATP-binding protein [Proteobacteria bacterium 005FR1]|nr:ABC transporter ATP-binding protein [Proteobacteria bacterium 005FR1]